MRSLISFETSCNPKIDGVRCRANQLEAVLPHEEPIMNANVEASVAELNGTQSCQAETCSAVQQIASFAFSARPEQLTEHNRKLYKRNRQHWMCGCLFRTSVSDRFESPLTKPIAEPPDRLTI
jgi:hypothetical protein